MKVQLVVYLAEVLVLGSVLALAAAPAPLLLAAGLPLPCHLTLHTFLKRAGLRRRLAPFGHPAPVPRLEPMAEGVR